MISQESLGGLGQEKCRICLESEGIRSSPCKCIGSVRYIHEECLNLWLSKALQNHSMKCQSRGNNRYSVKCQICKGQINFSMTSQKGCKPCSAIREQILYDKGKFVCQLLAFLIMSTIAGLVFYFSLSSMIGGQQQVLGIIFFIFFDIILLMIWIRFLHLFVSTFFIGTVYNIRQYEYH